MTTYQAENRLYPTALRADLVEQLPAPDGPHHVADPYRWLEDAEDEATNRWSAEQAELYATHRDSWGDTSAITSRLDELTQAGFTGPPSWRGERYFFMRRTGTQEHAVLMVREGENERVLFDPMQLNADGTTTLDSYQPSKEGDLLAYSLSEGGSEESALHVLDVATGEVVDGPIDRARFSSVSWLPGGESFIYMRQLPAADLPEDEQQYHRRVYWHIVGQPVENDLEIFGAEQPMTAIFSSQVSMSGAWAVVSVSYGTDPRNDVFLAPLTSVEPHQPEFSPVVQGIDARFGVSVDHTDTVWIHTDHEAPRGRLFRALPTACTPEHWELVIGTDDTAVLDDFAVLETGSGTELVVSRSVHTCAELLRFSPAGERLGEIALPGTGTIGGLVTRPGASPDLWFVYTDQVTAPQVMHYIPGSEPTVWFSPDAAAPRTPLHSQLIEVTSPDGTTVRAFVVSPADSVNSDGNPTKALPTILYGYGGFGISLSPTYSAGTVAWCEAGGRYVVAMLRGGGEEGEQWHRDGMLGNKQNVFDDFYACGEALIERGFTPADGLAASGGSNGGLLVGTAAVQRPDLFRAVVCSAPLLDMARFSLHGLGQFWVGEYGDAQKADELEWLLAYSPYHNVHQGQEYPAVLFTVFEGDSRVDPLHARKLCAALQHATASSRATHPVLIRAEENVGHGARARSKGLGLNAEVYGFLGKHLGWPAA